MKRWLLPFALLVFCFSAAGFRPALALTAEEKIVAGREALLARDLVSAKARFAEALALAPANQEAAALLGFARVFAIAKLAGTDAQLNRLGVNSTGRDVYGWTAELTTDSWGDPVFSAGYNLAEGADYWRDVVLPESALAQGNLALVTGRFFQVNVTAGEAGGHAWTADYGDVLLSRAILRFSDFLAHAALSNDLHFDIASASQLLCLRLDVLHRLLADNPDFLTPSATAGDRRSQAKAALLDALRLYREASAFIRARPAGQVRLFMLEARDLEPEAEARRQLDLVERAVVGTVPLTDRGQPMLGTLAPVFEAGFSGRALLPVMTERGFDAFSIPDTTFGGTLFGLSRAGAAWGFAQTGSSPHLGWEQLNPAAEFNRWTAYASTVGAHVQVGAGGKIRFSTDGVVWQTRVFPEVGQINAVVHGSGGFVAVCSKAILQSADGLVWRKVHAVSEALNDVAYGNGLYVAVGNLGMLFYSTDGRKWRRSVTADYEGNALNSFRGVAFGAGQFIVVNGGPGKIVGSTDGLTWTTRLASGVSSLYDVAYGNGVFVCVGASGQVAISGDGSTWTPSTLKPAGASSFTHNAIAFSQGRFLTVGTTSTYAAAPVIHTSTDGAAWVQAGTVDRHAVFNMSPTSDGFLLFGSTGALIRTADGAVLSLTGNTNPLVPYGRTFYRMRSLRGKLWVTGGDGTLLASSDGVSFEVLNSGVTTTLNDIVDFDGTLYAVGAGGTVIASTDGIQWASRVTNTSATFYRALVANGKLWICGSGTVKSTADGITFGGSAAAGGATLNAMAFGNGFYVAAGSGETGSIQVSADGVTWVADPSVPKNYFRDVAYIDGAFWATGQDGLLLRSTTGLGWTRVEIGAKTHLGRIAKLGGRYFVSALSIGDFNEDEAQASVFVSEDAVNWVRCSLPASFEPFNPVEHQGRIYLTTSVSGILRSAVLPAVVAPSIVRAPGALVVKVGDAARLSVAATGEGALTFEWARNGQPIASSNTAELDLGAATTGIAGTYQVTVRNAAGQVSSTPVTVTVEAGQTVPVITVQPVSQSVLVSRGFVFTTVAAGNPQPAFQWYKGGAPVPGATLSSYSVAAASTADAGAYFVRVSNAAGSVDSQIATVSVENPSSVYWQTHDASTDDGMSFPQRTVHDGKGGLLLPSFNGIIDIVGEKTVGPLMRLSESGGAADLAFTIGGVFMNSSFVQPVAGGALLVAGKTARGFTVARFSAAGALDAAFSAKGPVFDRGIRFLTVQEDGRIILAVVDNVMNNPPAGTVVTQAMRIYRLLADGSLDATFTSAQLSNMVFAQPVLDASGRIYLAGTFTTVNGVARRGIARLSATGELDSFAAPESLPAGFATNAARGLGIQSDGKVVVVGAFRHNGKAFGSDYIGAIRFLADGTFDDTYAQPLVLSDMKIGSDGLSGSKPRCMAMLADDRVLLVSDRVVRLLPSGVVDTAFSSQALDREAYWLSVGADGRIYVPGPLSLGGVEVNGLAVFLPSGLPDYSFKSPVWGNLAPPAALVAQDNGVWLGGSFNRMGALAVPGVAMLDAQGQALPQQVSDASLGVVSKRPSAQLVKAASTGSAYLLWSDTAAPSRFVRLRADGTADPTFNPQFGGDSTLAQPSVWTAVHAAPDGRVYLQTRLLEGGGLKLGVSLNGLVRFQADGARDYAFVFGVLDLVAITRNVSNQPTLATHGAFKVAQVMADGKLLLLVARTDGTIRVVRLLPSGAVDGSFVSVAIGQAVPSTTYYSNVFDPVSGTQVVQLQVNQYGLGDYRDAVQGLDGKVYVGGRLKLPGADAERSLIRLNADGTIDAAFDLVPTYAKDPLAPAEVAALALDGSGRVYAAGRFDRWGGQPVGGLARLTGVGAVDSAWAPGVSVADYPSLAVALEPVGSKLYLVGSVLAAGEVFPTRHHVLDIGTAPYTPVVLRQPASQTAVAGSAIQLSVEAIGIPAPTYQWSLNGVAITGATNATYSIAQVTTAQAGTYTVALTNAGGTTVSTGASLVVNSIDTLTCGLLNFSQRGLVEVGARAPQSSFTVEGVTTKSVLIRGIGPALATFGVTGVLANPKLTVRNSQGAVVAANDDWWAAANAADVINAFGKVGAMPLTQGSADTAILAAFAPGTYHVTLEGVGQTTGICLFELYDVDVPPRIPYLSLRTTAGVGTDALIAGFVVAEPGPRRFLIRAVGNDLRGPGTLNDPVLSLFQSNGTLAGRNDNWTDSPALSSATALTGLEPLTGNNGDAVLLVDLAAGSYVAQIAGANATSGTVLLEIAEVDASRATSMAPAIVSQPLPMTVGTTHTSATFGVRAVGIPAPSYQWYRDGVALPGATGRSIIISTPTANDLGNYTVRVTNIHGNVLSEPAQLTSTTIVGYHSADANRDWKIDLGELTRVIQLYNTRNAGLRTGAYAVVQGSADGFAPDTARAGGQAASLSTYHSADTNRNGCIDPSELLVVIGLYNIRSGAVRTGGYGTP